MWKEYAIIRSMAKKTSVKKHNFFITILLIVIMVFIGIFIYSRTFLPVAKVNGVRITRVEFINELQKQAGQKVLDNMITKTLIYQEATKRKIFISDEPIQNEIKKIETDLKTKKTTLDTMLAAENITRNDLYERIKFNLTTQKIVEKYTQVSDKEVETFIEKNPQVFQNRELSKSIKADIKERLRQQKIAEQVKILINNLKKNSKVEVYIK